MKYYTLYNDDCTIIRIEGDHFSWQDHTAELLEKVKDPTLGEIWRVKEYEGLYALAFDIDNPELFCSFCYLADAFDSHWSEHDMACSRSDEDKLEELESEEVTISFRGNTARIVWSPAADDILSHAIKVGIAESLSAY